MITTGANMPKVTAEDMETARKKYIAKLGRPTKYTPDMAAEICARVDCGETIKRICQDKNMPAEPTIYDWKRHLPEFAQSLARARQNAATSMVDTGLGLLDGLAIQKFDDEGKPIKLDMTTIRLAEMRSKYRFELAKCLDREQYGPNVQVSQTITVETMDQQIARLTGQVVTIPAEFEHLVED